MGRPAALRCAAAAALLCAAARGPARGFSAPAARGPPGRSAQGAPPGGCREEAEGAGVGLAAGAVGLRAAALALAIGVAASAAAAARAADGAAPPSAERGAAVFAGNCAACHAGGNNAVQADKLGGAQAWACARVAFGAGPRGALRHTPALACAPGFWPLRGPPSAAHLTPPLPGVTPARSRQEAEEGGPHEVRHVRREHDHLPGDEREERDACVRRAPGGSRDHGRGRVRAEPGGQRLALRPSSPWSLGHLVDRSFSSSSKLIVSVCFFPS
ncbi:unnamed protein product [Prorocentrum cordatum]|uniref:Cytochrome c domain-containing protein n=1 Tax=Prorocentrum cordatum TaxID=2364126 RepID=A0ABN9SCA3_9DINO|nr:unnamed protein product [Polarella glacialis]